MRPLFTIIALLLTLCACNTQKREIRQLDGLALKQPVEFARLSNMLNPCFSGKAKSDTVIKYGKPDTIITAGRRDTIRHKDTVIITNTLPGRTIKIPTTVTIHDTIADGRAIMVVNNNLKIAGDSLLVVKTQLAQVKHSRSIWMWIAIGLLVICVGYGAIKVYSLFTGAAIA